MVKVAVFAVAPCACAATVYFVPEYGFFVDVHFVLASLKVPASVEPSLPVTFTVVNVPSATVTVTGAVKSAFLVPSAGETVTVGAFAAFTDAVAGEPPEEEPSAAPAEPLQPVRTAAAGTTPRTVRTPRRDHLSDCFSDRLDMCDTPTARLPPHVAHTAWPYATRSPVPLHPAPLPWGESLNPRGST